MLTKFWVTPELFVIPAPLKVSPARVEAVKVKAAAPRAKTISLTSVAAEIEIAPWLEAAKVAMSPGPFGTVAGVQLAAVFQSPLVGLRFQVALPAWAGAFMTSKSNAHRNSAGIGWRGEFIGSFGWGRVERRSFRSELGKVGYVEGRMSGKRSTPVTEQDRKGTLDPARDGEIDMAVAVEIGH